MSGRNGKRGKKRTVWQRGRNVIYQEVAIVTEPFTKHSEQCVEKGSRKPEAVVQTERGSGKGESRGERICRGSRG